MTQGQVRIISGSWRGRKLKVPDVPGLRPTPDRVRETLFNWLQPYIGGAHCLDLFAGSGALGFEALSRGAAHVIMMDQSAKIIELLKQEKEILKADNAEIYQGLAPHQLKIPQKLIDIVFLDPPFKEDILISCCEFLEKKPILAAEAYIYLEAEHEIKQETLPSNWQLLKSKKAGNVAYHLALRKKIVEASSP